MLTSRVSLSDWHDEFLIFILLDDFDFNELKNRFLYYNLVFN